MSQKAKLGLFQGFIFIVLLFVLACVPLRDTVLVALNKDNIIVDDARQLLFPFVKFWQASAFSKHGFFEQYYLGLFQNKTILGLIYKCLSLFTDNLVQATKILSIIVSLLSSLFAYLYFNLIFKSRFYALFAAFVASLFFWMIDDIASATNRAFMILLLLGYLYLKQKSESWILVLWQVFAFLIYPCAFLLIFIAEVCSYINSVFCSFINREQEVFNLKKLFIVLLPALIYVLFYFIQDVFILSQSQKVKLLDISQMQTLLEFGPAGRHRIWTENLISIDFFKNQYLGFGFNSIALRLLNIGGLFSFVVFCFMKLFSKKASCNNEDLASCRYFVKGLYCLGLSALISFILAFVFFPKLYLPSRYLTAPLSLISLVLILSLFYLVISSAAQYLSKWASKASFEKVFSNSFIVILFLILLFPAYPSIKKLYAAKYHYIPAALLSKIQSLPSDACIAIMPHSDMSSTIPALTGREVFLDYERSVVPNQEYIDEVRKRHKELYRALYAKDINIIKEFAQKNKVDYFLVQEVFYSDSFMANPRYIEPYYAYLKKEIGRTLKDGSSGGIVFKEILDDSSEKTLLLEINSSSLSKV